MHTVVKRQLFRVTFKQESGKIRDPFHYNGEPSLAAKDMAEVISYLTDKGVMKVVEHIHTLNETVEVICPIQEDI